MNQNKNMMTNKTKKIVLLIERFFFTSSKTNFTNIENYEYFELVKFDKLFIHEIQHAINDVFNNKISKNDEIQNRVLTLLIKITNLLNLLKQLFQASLNQKHCFKHFKKSITVCLRKFDKDNYSIFKNYKSIVLLFIINKVLKSILINRLA